MSTARYRHMPSMSGRAHLPPALLCLLLLAPSCALAQSPPSSDGSWNSSSSSNSSDSNNNGNYFNPNFNPSMAIVIVVLISAFFFLGFSSIFIRNCAERDEEGSVRGGGGRAAGARSRRQQGLKPEVLESFPALVYSEVKEHKIGKGTLECAVCLSEFEDDETLRLLPGCNHVFHVDCIDAWLSSHVTCPVCRSNLVDAANRAPDSSAPAGGAGHDVPIAVPSPPPEHVAVVIDQPEEEKEADEQQQKKEEAMELAELGSQQRESRSRSGRQPTRFPRSHSTGHSMVRRQPTAAGESCECADRYTLRLPEHVMREIFAAKKFHRSASCMAFPTDGEGSSRPGYRAGEGSSHGGRSVRGFGRSDRWPSFFKRTLSAKFPGWRRGGGDGEESFKKGNGEGSTTRGRFAAVMTPFECLNGGATADGAKAEVASAAASVEPESKSDALARGV